MDFLTNISLQSELEWENRIFNGFFPFMTFSFEITFFSSSTFENIELKCLNVMYSSGSYIRIGRRPFECLKIACASNCLASLLEPNDLLIYLNDISLIGNMNFPDFESIKAAVVNAPYPKTIRFLRTNGERDIQSPIEVLLEIKEKNPMAKFKEIFNPISKQVSLFLYQLDQNVIVILILIA